MKYAEILRARAAEARGVLATLDAERQALKVEAEALTADESRSLDAAEDARLSAILARNAEIKVEADKVEADAKADEARAAELDALDVERSQAPTFIRPTDKVAVGDIRGMSQTQLVDSIVRGAEEREIDPSNARRIIKRHAVDADGNVTEWLRGIAARSTDTYARAFSKVVTGREMTLTNEERAALSVGTNANGGFLVPTHLDPTIILTNTGSSNVIRTLARVVTLTEGMTWNGVTSAGSSFSWDAELAEVSDDTPNDMARSAVTCYKGGGFIQASVEALANINQAASDVLMLFADGKDRLEGAAHATGSGSSQPFGIFTAINASTSRQTVSTTAATIGLVDLQATKRAVGQRWRNKGTFVAHPYWADLARSAIASVTGAYPGSVANANTDVILGRPIVETDDGPSTTTTTVKDQAIVFGDFSNYVVVDKPGSTSIQYIPTLFNTANNLPDGRSGWYMHFFNGADSVNDAAFSILVDKTSA